MTSSDPTAFSRLTPEQLVGLLKPEQKAKLLSGESFWYTHAVPELGIPAIGVR
jgi:hypothetical protein